MRARILTGTWKFMDDVSISDYLSRNSESHITLMMSVYWLTTT
jgi:hypothetical protein